MLPQAWYREGLALEGLGRWEAAANAYFEACRLEPKSKVIAAAFRRAVASAREAHLAGTT